MRYIPRICMTPPAMTGYTLDSTAAAWPQHVKFIIPGHLFKHLRFRECPCRHKVNLYSRLCHDYGQMIFDLRMTDGYFRRYASN